jgi:hypothetical protein
MRAALQLRQHRGRGATVDGLAEKARAQAHHRVGSEHERIGLLLGHDARLAVGVDLGRLVRGEVFRLNFRRMTGLDCELDAEFSQKIRAAR